MKHFSLIILSSILMSCHSTKTIVNNDVSTIGECGDVHVKSEKEIKEIKDTIFKDTFDDKIFLESWFVSVPPTYKTVDGEVIGSTITYDVVQADYKTVKGVITVKPYCYKMVVDGDGRLQKEFTPPTLMRYHRIKMVSPAQIVKRVVPYKTIDGKTRVAIRPGYVVEKFLSF
ncbi:MAG: hypothetical protein COA43_13655 [Robiginitomaculum sp.]|nr:MAG: hypothetical protein COA43_13655 [Robiginitomaculum sp.]